LHSSGLEGVSLQRLNHSPISPRIVGFGDRAHSGEPHIRCHYPERQACDSTTRGMISREEAH
jgi:hypothetical protein